MSKSLSKLSGVLVFVIVAAISTLGMTEANAAPIDVRYLQTCLKEEGSSLDVLVLMDSSASLRNSTREDPWYPKYEVGSDPEKLRGKILKSSLRILRSLADESDSDFRISLRNFGNNSDPKELQELKSHWQEWSDKTSDAELDKFVDHALYDDSSMTEWASGLASAKKLFKQRIGEAELDEKKSCSIMFWITDGAPTDPTTPICAEDSSASINWFRENNVLVLGGLLKPQEGKDRIKASQFGPIVRGEICGRNEESWTKGEVVEANNIGDLAWKFVGLIASIKNLINLDSENSTFYVDPSTSHIEISIRGDQKNWQIKQPDGKVICSSSDPGKRCEVQPGNENGITTIEIYPETPVKSAGLWEISPKIEDDNIQVYGGLNSSSEQTLAKQAKLQIDTRAEVVAVDEGKEVSLKANIVNADGSPFSMDGYKSVTICAKVDSDKSSNCKIGSTSALLTVSPATSDKSVGFEAILVSAHDDSREYRITASVKIKVQESAFFPSLSCGYEIESCKLENIPNKKKPSVSFLKVLPANSGSTTGAISIVGLKVLSDSVQDRGEEHFNFSLENKNGEVIDLNSQSNSFSPGDQLKLTLTTDVAGDGEVQGIIKYKSISEGKELNRQLMFTFEVKEASNEFIRFALLLLAYLITIGLPYLFLLWSARRAAVLMVSDNEFAYLEHPLTISENGKVSSKASIVENSITTALDAPHEGLRFEAVEPGARSISISGVLVEVIPPKWNPFVEPITRVYIEGNHVMSTYGGSEFYDSQAIFSRTLTNEALVYFPTESNLSPVSQEYSSPESSSALFAPSTSEVTEAVLVKKSGEVLATAIYFVPRYGNRAKSMNELNLKLKDTLDGTNLVEHISSLRQISLETELLKIEELKKANLAKSEKSPKKASKETKVDSGRASEEPAEPNSFSYFEDHLDNSEKNFFTDEGNDSDPNSDKKFWD
jgi:hypothetical protein